jgi:hypothetical protein
MGELEKATNGKKIGAEWIGGPVNRVELVQKLEEPLGVRRRENGHGLVCHFFERQKVSRIVAVGEGEGGWGRGK